MLPENSEIYFTIAKFINHIGFSLTQNDNEEFENPKLSQILNQGAIPEFVQISDSFEMYRYFTEANLKNKLLVKSKPHSMTEEQLELSNIKDDLILMQFKLVDK